jgi:nitroimidazol reductase NimA-like FMN-containing flavoprotein (pyridoxamine 5'-phosphate oxidase superfamily)
MRTIIIKDRSKIEEAIRKCKICYFAMSLDNMPYVLPMNFAVNGDEVILHSAQSGRMWDTLKKNPKVCINWTNGEELAWQDVRVGCSYRVKSVSVVAEGTVEFIDSCNEKEDCLKLLMGQYSDRQFKFNAPAVKNVGIIKVHIDQISAKEFGASPQSPHEH